jgi:hypothetical protein
MSFVGSVVFDIKWIGLSLSRSCGYQSKAIVAVNKKENIQHGVAKKW